MPWYPAVFKSRNIHFVEAVVTDIRDGGWTVIANGEAYTNDALFIGIGPWGIPTKFAPQIYFEARWEPADAKTQQEFYNEWLQQRFKD